MSEQGKAFQEARERKAKSSAKVVDSFISNYYAWDYGFFDGWNEAMLAKFDDRATLAIWHRSSKHIFCPCNEQKRCKNTCPHGLPIMSGVCEWCINKFNEIEKKVNAENKTT